jgi:predicted TIM-barrel fold metal-dependent hydrolase
MSQPRTILPPDPNPIKPGYTPPPDACDAHCHIFGPAHAFPYAPNRTYTPADAGKETLAALHRHLGFSRAVLVQASCHGTDNSAMVDAMRWSKGRWRGVAMVGKGATDRELEELHAAGARGARFNFVAHLGGAPDLQAVSEVISRIEPLGWHVELHLDAEDIGTYRAFLDKLPVPFIIDHMGRIEARHGLDQPAFREMLDLMKNERAWVKVSGADRVSSKALQAGGAVGTGRFDDAVPFAQALIAAAPDRVLWGTDFPHPNAKVMPNDGELVDLFARICTGEAMRRKILIENPNRLYWPERLSASQSAI